MKQFIIVELNSIYGIEDQCPDHQQNQTESVGRQARLK